MGDDPIDGTTNLVKQGKDYCLIVSLFYDGEPLLAYTYEFYQQKLYKAVQGQGVTINGVPLYVDKYYHLNDALISIDPKRASSELLKALISHAHGFDLLALVALVHCVQSLVIAVQVLIWEQTCGI